jgi:hypothetical protein
MRIAAVMLALACFSGGFNVRPAALASVPAPPQDAAVLSEDDGLQTMRRLIAAQLDGRPEGERYSTLSIGLLRRLPTVQSAPHIDPDTVSFKGYRLRMTLSADGRHFQTSLTPESGCGTSWFSDERGVIYVGRANRCATN